MLTECREEKEKEEKNIYVYEQITAYQFDRLRLYKHVMLWLSLIMRLLHIFFHLQLLI